MTRPLRLEFAGAIYHITARGDRREDIFFQDEDRTDFLNILSQVCSRFNWVVHAYCLMTNHYHLVVETVDGNLARGMRQLNGVYTQLINRKHHLVGHLFQGRYKAILVQKEAYLLELSRYVVLNPVRANMVTDPAEWHWSNYRTVIAEKSEKEWLDSDWLLSQFGHDRQTAIKAYRRFVLSGINMASPLLQARHQVLLGDESFVTKYQDGSKNDQLRDISKAQRKTLAPELTVFQQMYPNRDEAMARAYLSGAYTMKEIALHFGCHYMTVSRSVKSYEQKA